MPAESSILTAFGGVWATIPQSALEYVLGVGVPFDPLSAPYDAARAFFNAAGYVVNGGLVYKVEADLSTNLYIDPADPRRVGINVPGLSSVSVDGHSLGGHLAMAFSRLFPDATQSATAVNGLGFKIGDSNVNTLYTVLGNLPSSPMGTGTTFDASKIQNVYGIAGAEFAAMNNSVLQQPGQWSGIYIETGGLGGHSSIQMTDSLAVYNLFANLSPALNTASDGLNIISNILKASSNIASNTLESVVMAISKLVGFTNRTFVDNQFDTNRNALYQAIDDIYYAHQGIGGTFTVCDLSTWSATQLANAASSDLGYRYALQALNPFALTGNDALYAQHNQLGKLDVYDPATGHGQLTESYLADRTVRLCLTSLLN